MLYERQLAAVDLTEYASGAMGRTVKEAVVTEWHRDRRPSKPYGNRCFDRWLMG